METPATEQQGTATPASSSDDRYPVPKLVRQLFGKLVGDKGYLSQALFEQLFQQGVHLVTKLKANMNNRLMDMTDKLLQRRSLP